MRERKKSKIKFLCIIGLVIVIFVGVIFGGYLIIDKKMVPNYLGKYGINNLHELTELANAMYKVPKETEFLTNSYSDTEVSATMSKLKTAGFPTLLNGNIDYKKLAENTDFERVPDSTFTDTTLTLTDKEIAIILDSAIKSNVLTTTPNLNYLNTTSTSIDVKQVFITKTSDENEILPNKANLQMTIKLDTASLRSTMARNLDTPTFLIDWLIPDVMYLTALIDIELTDEVNFSNIALSVNTKDSSASKVLLNLLISFIYPETENVTIESLASEFGTLLIDSMKLLSSDMQFTKIITKATTTSGLNLTLR